MVVAIVAVGMLFFVADQLAIENEKPLPLIAVGIMLVLIFSANNSIALDAFGAVPAEPFRRIGEPTGVIGV